MTLTENNLYLVRITSPGNGNPTYWYAPLIGSEFHCIYKQQISDRRNGFEKFCFETISGVGVPPVPSMDGIINPSDCMVIQEISHT